jgi:CDP-diacylglycerol---serine O-phosphatidyltransferase
MEPPFPPFDPEGNAVGKRLRDIPLKAIFPNLLTLLAICSGLTAIRFSIEGRLELAVGAIILAAFLDGIDGRVARFLKSTSRFGAEMDSLADFVNFGVAPAMLLYFTLLDSMKAVGWIVALLFAICACLRLARFNVMLEMPGTPKWQRNFFVGVPAPAGALAGLAPIYAMLLGMEPDRAFVIVSAVYALVIAFLMVSNLPSFSGKEMTKSIPRAFVLPILVLVVAVIALLLTYPWEMLLAFTALYILSLPFSLQAWRRLSSQGELADAVSVERSEAAEH